VALAQAGRSIAAGATSASVAVTINGDTAVEGNETFLVNLSNVSGASVADGQATGTILNDDASLPQLSVADVSISEGRKGTKKMVFTLRLSAASASPVGYSVATGNLTATAGSDYAALNLAGQSIPAGATSKTVSVAIIGDLVKEPNETFSLTVSNVSNASVADGYAIGTILNDDRR
jgi:hypothetical protein